MHATRSQIDCEYIYTIYVCVCLCVHGKRNTGKNLRLADTDKSCEAHLQESSADRKNRNQTGTWLFEGGEGGGMLQNVVVVRARQLRRSGLKMSATLAGCLAVRPQAGAVPN